MIDKADLDNDGLVSEEEFYQIMTKRAKWSYKGSGMFINCSNILKLNENSNHFNHLLPLLPVQLYR